GGAAANLRFELGNFFFDDASLPVEGRQTAFELKSLSTEHSGDLWVICLISKFLRDIDLILMRELCSQSLFHGTQHQILLGQDIVFGARLRIVEDEDDLTGFDAVPFFYEKLLDNSAIEMLHAFPIALDLHKPVAHHGSVQRSRDRPCAEPEK